MNWLISILEPYGLTPATYAFTSTQLVTSLVGLTLLFALRKRGKGPYSHLPLPPGPRRLPWIGNAHNFPQVEWYDELIKLINEHGEVVYANILGRPLVILGSLDAAEELLNKKSANFSGRIGSYMIMEMMGWEWSPVFVQPGHEHQEGRKMLRRAIGPTQIPKHYSLIESETANLLKELRTVKGDPIHAVSRAVGSVIMQVAYGRQLWEEHGKTLIQKNQEAVDLMGPAFQQFWLVDYLHWIRHFPSFLPGMGFKRLGQRSRKLMVEIRSWPFNYALNSFRTQGPNNSLASDLIEVHSDSEVVKNVVGILYAAGADTTVSVVVNFIYAMYLHPDVLKQLQAEIDNVVGQERLPTLKDREGLKYVEAVWKESLRWAVPVPLSVPHVSSVEDEWKGMRIPEGSMVMTHIGYMLSDPRAFKDPSVFRPERWLEPGADDLPNPSNLVFGFGQRICPGRHIADKMGWAMIAAIGATYDIVPLEGEQPPTKATYIDSAIRTPKDFKCRFIPRSEEAANILDHLNI